MSDGDAGQDITVTRGADRFTVALDGHPVGFAEFSDHAGRRTFFHTEVDRRHQGRGLASTLVAAALAATRADGLRIVAPCSMVAAYAVKSGEYDDLLDPA